MRILLMMLKRKLRNSEKGKIMVMMVMNKKERDERWHNEITNHNIGQENKKCKMIMMIKKSRKELKSVQ